MEGLKLSLRSEMDADSLTDEAAGRGDLTDERYWLADKGVSFEMSTRESISPTAGEYLADSHGGLPAGDLHHLAGHTAVLHADIYSGDNPVGRGIA